jgi:flagellar basal body rod protein FlgG
VKSKFEPSEVSGEKEYAAGAKIKQGFLEDSNVEAAVEFTRLIRTQRAFSLAGARAVNRGQYGRHSKQHEKIAHNKRSFTLI